MARERCEATVGRCERAALGIDGRRALIDHLEIDRRRFVAVAERILRCRARAEDVVQDVALKLWQDRPAIALDHPGRYIGRMVRNQAVDRLRQVGLECRLLAPIRAADAVACTAPCPRRCIEDRDALRRVFTVLDAAPERDRRLMLSHRLDGERQNTLATRSGVSATLVSVIIRDTTALCREAVAEVESGPRSDQRPALHARPA